MNKLQSMILLIAKEVKRICEKHNIPYYIYSGTQIGAVRHKGFIPWDDDFDIVMKRKDFEKFIQVCSVELDKDQFFLQTEDTEKNYCFAFAKIRLNGTKIIEDFSKNVPIHDGIFVDIFPFDRLPDNYIERKWLLAKNHLLKNMIWIKCGYGEDRQKKKASYKIIKILNLPFSISFLKKKRYKLITSYNNKQTTAYFVSDYPKKVYKAKWYKNHEDYIFEGELFSGNTAQDMHESLTMIYGDYMKIPPENERIRHSEYDVDFGPYTNQEV